MRTITQISTVLGMVCCLVFAAHAQRPEGRPSGGRDGGRHSGPPSGSTRYSDSHYSGDRYHRHHSGSRSYWSWGFSFGWPGYGFYDYPYYPDYPYYRYYYWDPVPYGFYYPTAVRYYRVPPPVEVPPSSPPDTNAAPATVETGNKDRPLPPSAVYKGNDGFPESPPERTPLPPAQPPPPEFRTPSLSPTDVKMLVKEGLSDEVIMSQMKQSRAVYRLTAQEIIDLKESGVSEKLINYMINTPSR